MRERDIFLGAIDLPAPARAAYLDAACGGDTGLRGRVEALLRSHEDAGSFLNFPVTSPDAGSPPTRPYPAPDADLGDDTAPAPCAGAGDADDVLAFLAPPGRPDSLGRVGHYEVLEVLGRGGFGIVFRAFDETLQRVVAVKVLAPSMAATSPARKRFLREARSSAAIRHENVVQAHAVEEQPLPHIVMEFVPGESLQQRLDRAGPLDPAEVLAIGRQVAEGLAAAHATGVVHRDIKPANILVEPGTHRARITDFGLARAADDASLTRSGTVAGTPLYMAPEQARGESLDHRADLFSLGSVLYALLTGRPPFRADTTLAVLKRVADDTPRPIREVIPEVPEWFCRVVETLHAKNPADRFQTAREVADVLADCERQLAAHREVRDSSRIPARPLPPRGPSRRRKRAAAAVAVLALVLVPGGVLFGRAAVLYASGRGEVEVEGDGTASVAVLRDGVPVAGGPGETFSGRIQLPPGRYTLAARPRTRSHAVTGWAVIDINNLGVRGGATTTESDPPRDLVLEVKRGRRVVARPVVHPRPAGEVQRDLDGESLQGNWVAEKVEFRSKSLPEEECRQFRLTFTGRNARLSLPGGKTVEGTFHLDATRLPREIDVVGTDGKWVRGVYHGGLIGTLTICVGEAGGPRPTGLGPSLDPDSKQMLATLRRESAAPAPFALAARDGKPERTFATVAELIAAADETDRVEVRGLSADPDDARVKRLCAELVDSAHRNAGGRDAIVAAKLMAQLAWPADSLKRAAITPEQFAAIGIEGPAACPTEVVAVVGTSTGGYRPPVVAISPDGRCLVYTALKGEQTRDVVVWDVEQGAVRHTLTGHGGDVTGAAFSPDGKTLATSSKDKTVKLWDVETGGAGATLVGPQLELWSVAFSPDGRWVAAGGGSSPSKKLHVYLWDAEARGLVRTLDLPPAHAVTSVAFGRDGKTLVALSNELAVIGRSGKASIRFWEVPGGRPLDALATTRAAESYWGIRSLAYSPDGKTLAAPEQKPTLKLWDTDPVREQRTLAAGDQVFRCVCFSPDGERLAAAGREFVAVWNPRTGVWAGKVTLPLAGTVAFMPDGRHLAVCREDGVVVVLRFKGPAPPDPPH